jgi:hypothetical protein
MYELNRARMAAVGPRAARYTDVVLDLSGVGAPTESTRTLFGATRRPSPFSLLVLENGGGKTVLLKLLFSVLLPGRRKALGGGTNQMDKFVVDTDTGHVALEWMHVGTGELVVTGKALQRRTKPTAGQSPVAESWYSFRPGAALTLDTLPLADNGRRLRLDGYREALTELNRTEPGLQLNWASDRELGQWTRHLRDLGLEPDLFDIQRSMNVDEGDAANPFTFRTSAEFVNWLLTTVTDPADARAVVDTFDQWAETLAGRDAMVLERDFLDGAIAGLDPLAEAHGTAQQADKDAAAARTGATRLAAALLVRCEQEQHEAASIGQRLTTARGELTAAETGRDRGREVLNEVERLTLLLELVELNTRKSGIDEDRAAAADLVEAWRVVPDVHASNSADAEAAAVADLLRAKDSEAAPALTRRDRAAGELLAALAGTATDQDNDALRLTRDAAAAMEDADGARRDGADAAGEQGRLREKIEANQRRARAADTALDEAAAAGTVSAGTTVHDLPRLVDAAVHEKVRLEGEQDTAHGLLGAARIAVTERAGEERAARVKQQSADAAATAAASAREAAQRAADRVAALPALRELAGLETGETLPLTDLDEHADRFLHELRTAAEQHQSALDQLRLAHEQDQRVLDALGDGGLLPPREDVERAVTKLAAAGVIAYPGWRYLAQAAPASDRAALIDAHPELVDGVVVLDPGQLELARGLLEQEQMLPAAAVAVGTGALLLSVTAAPEDRFVVEPSLALYDTAAATKRREALAAAMAIRSAHIAELTDQRARQESTASQLEAWRAISPPGHLQQLAGAERDRDGDAERARLEHESAEKNLSDAQQAQDEAEKQLNQARDHERAAADLLRDLQALAAQAATALAAADDLPELRLQLGQQARIAGQAAQRVEELVEQAAQLRVRAEAARNTAARLRQDMSEVESSTGRPAPERSTGSVAHLRSAYLGAQRLYLDAAPGDELKKQAKTTADRAQRLRDRLKQYGTDHVAVAVTLLAGPDGDGQGAWERAAERARQRAEQLRQQDTAITELIGQKKQAVITASRGGAEGRAGAWTSLPVEQQPDTVEHGRQLLDQARDTQRQLQKKVDDATSIVASLDQQREQATQRVNAFEQAYLPLGAVLAVNTDDTTAATDSPVAAAYAGTSAAAAAASTSATDALTTTSKEAARAHTEVARRHDELVTFVRDDTYEKLRAQIRSLILNSSQARVAGSAAEWSVQLMARRVSLQQDLDSVDKHRATIVERMSALVDRALKTLRLAARLSRLPDTLGDWSGREFLHIGFSQPDLTTIGTRVGDVIDLEAAAVSDRAGGGRATGRSSGRRDGMGLLLKAVHAAVPHGFTVTVLKPDQVLRDERVPVEEMGGVFSGGQELTAAIMLYCTLAAVKGNERGQMRTRHSGVLFLDNPIGKASARYLLDMQKQVAAALGVQLVYTTGLSDDRALAAFPLWIRMRNDADLRAGLKHIRVSDVVRAALPDPYEGDDTALQPGTVTAARVNLRPDHTVYTG